MRRGPHSSDGASPEEGGGPLFEIIAAQSSAQEPRRFGPKIFLDTAGTDTAGGCAGEVTGNVVSQEEFLLNGPVG